MEYLKRLHDVLEADQRVELSEYIDIVRRAIREAPADARELLQVTYERGLQEAYSSPADGALAKVALMGATQLNVVGEHAGAIARLEQALQMATDDPSSRAEILAEKAFYEALSADPSSAATTQAEALAAIPDEIDRETSLSVETTAAMVSLLLFEPDATESAAAVTSRTRSNEFDWMASALMVYLVSALASSSDASQATAWADALHGYAASLPHEARELDATVAQFALSARRRLVDPPTELREVGVRTLNSIACWRLEILRLYESAIRGDATEALRSADELEELRAELNDGFTILRGGFRAFVEAYFEATPVVDLQLPPQVPSILMLSGVLASAEAVAIGGSQSAAADWLRWLQNDLSPRVATSLEWPACRLRVEGLLLLRLGREREAVTRMQDSIACCEERGDLVQAAIGQVQLSEALMRGTTASMLPATHARSLAQAGSERLRAIGIDPIPFAYAASRTFLREEQMPERGGLTPREAQVLGRLARGLTYREIGSDLGINSRTVGVHASHCYEKLGVRNRVEAVKLAQDLGIV